MKCRPGEGHVLLGTLGYPVIAVHVPKTVDNDLAVTDNSPGFGSVAKYVATSMREAAFDVASMARTSTKVFVLEVMGRHAGWITAAVGLADDEDTPIPLVRCSPRSRSTRRRSSRRSRRDARVRLLLHRGSEGLLTADGKLMAETGMRDAFGHAQLGGIGRRSAGLVKDRLGYKYHWRSPTTCSARRAIWHRRPTSRSRMPWAAPPWSWRSPATTR